MPRASRFLFGVVLCLFAVGVSLPAAAQLTLPASKSLTRIAFGSCADQDKPLPIFEKIAAAKPELLLLIGDNIYADLDKNVKVTPEVIREKYAHMAKVPGFQKLKAMCPMLGTWDDHDYGKNDAGAEWAYKDEAQKAFLDFFGVPAGDPRRTRKGVYHSATYGLPGKRVQIILLDTRYFRSALKAADKPLPGTRIVPYLPNTDPGATMLGDEQWKWLEGELKKPAEVRLLVSSIQVISEDHPFEKWMNMPKEREKLYALIRSTGANGVIILSGDRHLAEISLDTKAVGYPLYDITSSGLNQGFKGWRDLEKNGHRVAAVPYGDNFGFITIDWLANDAKIKFQVRDEDGDSAAGVTVMASTLKPGATATAVALPMGVIGPEQALKKVGEDVTVQMVVKSGRALKERVLLNSEVNYQSETNFTVVVNEKAMTGKFAKADFDTFKGKTIRVTGKVTMFRDAPQIEVNSEKQLQIVE